MHGKVDRWTVEVDLSELEGRTHARARLITGVEPPLQTTGDARLSEDDPMDVPEIGFELATARALRALADQLLTTAEHDVEGVIGKPYKHPRSESSRAG